MEKETASIQEKQLRLLKIQTGLIAGILAVILVFTLFCAVRVGDVVEMASQLNVEQINEAVGSLKAAADTLAAVDTEGINEGIQGLSDAAAGLEELDITKLNRFMDSLDGMADQLDSAAEIFKGIFGRK